MRARHIQRAQKRAQLLGPDGVPILPKEEVPFIQWLPDGKSVGRSIKRSSEVAAQAARFMAKGGRYAFVAFDGGKAELVAGFPMEDGEKGEMTVVAAEILPSDGPLVEAAVDRLVAASVANMDKFTVTEAA